MKLGIISTNALTLTAVFNASLREKVERELAITFSQYRILGAVHRESLGSVSKLSERLSVAPSFISTLTRSLEEKGLIRKDRAGQLESRIAATAKAVSLLQSAAALARETYEEVLSPEAGPTEAAFAAGFIATAVMVSGMVYGENGPDIPVMCAVVFSQAEQTARKTAKSWGLSFMDFRILLALAESLEGVTASQLAHNLVASKSTVSESVGRLKKKGFVEAERIDGRSSLLSVRAEAMETVKLIARNVDAAVIGASRPVRNEERAFYHLTADEAVRSIRIRDWQARFEV